MKKQKEKYQLKVFYPNSNVSFTAKRAMSFEIQLAAQLLLDNLCFKWNKERLEHRINTALDEQDEETFHSLSTIYASYL